MMAFWCSHVVMKENEPQMYCDNVPDEKNPVPVNNEKNCKNCSVGMIRRLRDDWDDFDYNDFEDDSQFCIKEKEC